MDCIDQASSLQLLDSVHHLAFMRQVVPIEDLKSQILMKLCLSDEVRGIVFRIMETTETNMMVDETIE